MKSKFYLPALFVVAFAFNLAAEDTAVNPTHYLLQSVNSKAETLSLLGALLSAGKDYEAVPSEINNLPITSQEKVDLWKTVRQSALDSIKADRYDPTSPQKPTGPDLRSFGTRFQEYRSTLRQAISDYYSEHAGEPTPVLSQVLDPAGIPSPQPAQITLSQVFSAGVPGLSAGFSATPGLNQGHTFWGHSTFSLSGLLLQPTGADPTFSSGELAFSYSSRRNVFDFLADYNGQDFLSSDLDFERAAANAANDLVARYQIGIKQGRSEADAIASAVETAGLTVKNQTSLYEQDHFIDSEQNRDLNSFLAGSARFRVTRDAQYLSDVPDLLSGALQIGGQLNLGGSKSFRFSLAGTADASASAWPTSTFQTLSAANASNSQLTLLVDGSVGASLYVPTQGRGTSKLTASLVGRWAFREAGEWSWGGAFALVVPITADMALAGTYHIFSNSTTGLGSTSGISFAKSLD